MSLDLTQPTSLQYQARRHADAVVLTALGQSESLSLIDHGDGRLELSPPAVLTDFMHSLVAFEALSNFGDEEVLIVLKRNGWRFLEEVLVARGVAFVLDDTYLGVFPETLWQIPDLWLVQGNPCFPQTLRSGPHGAHPTRAPKPTGQLYNRYIPWLDQVFGLRALDPDADLNLFHTWMNDERVAAFFEESGTLDYHRDYLAKMTADPHMMPVLGCLDGQPFCYFELYWAKENRLGAHYDADGWDRGWHVLVGDASARGADYITAWLPSLMHYMFLTEPRTQAIVGEPATSHTQQLRNLTRSGFARVKDFDFPHKRATLIRLERDYFFKARLWARPNPQYPGKPLRLSLNAQLFAGV